MRKKGEEEKGVRLIYEKEKNRWNGCGEGERLEVIRMNEEGSMSLKEEEGSGVSVCGDLEGMICGGEGNRE